MRKMKILLDTSVIIDFQRRKDKEETLVYKLFKEDLYISIVTHTEIYSGRSVWEKDSIRFEIEELFSGFKVLPLTEDISELAGRIKASNHDVSLLDCIIAGTSICHELKLLTLNIKDFKDIDGLELLKI
jgi:predicted nucleic acid-binding protein